MKLVLEGVIRREFFSYVSDGRWGVTPHFPVEVHRELYIGDGTHRMSLDVAIDDLEGLGVHRDGSRAKDKPVGGDHCLGEDVRHRIWCVLRQHASMFCLRHRVGLFPRRWMSWGIKCFGAKSWFCGFHSLEIYVLSTALVSLIDSEEERVIIIFLAWSA